MRFAAKASAELDEIWTYSSQQWDKAQADRYVAELRRIAYSLLDANPLARPVPAVPGHFRIRAERHFIYFKVRRGEVIIVRILHERMDPLLRLG